MARLLLVDDDRDTLEWMGAALRGLGHEVQCCTNAREALDVLDAWPAELIVADILMPEMDGLTFAKLARRSRGTPLMFVSIAGLQAEAVLAGAVAYVQKPAMFSEVREAVERVLGRDARDNTLLVVEDDHDVRELYRAFLAPRFVVLEAGDGREALEVLRTNAVDLVISDVHMPVMNGVELIRAIRANPELARLPIIVQTCDQTALSAPVWRDLNVSQLVPKRQFLRWLKQRIEAHVEDAARSARELTVPSPRR
jgi:CheY-like chemotaxis protein